MLQSMGSQRVGHNLATEQQHTYIHIKELWWLNYNNNYNLEYTFFYEVYIVDNTVIGVTTMESNSANQQFHF